MRTYAVLHDVENVSATVIYKERDDPVWYVYTAVVDLATAEQIVKALNKSQQPQAKKIAFNED